MEEDDPDVNQPISIKMGHKNMPDDLSKPITGLSKIEQFKQPRDNREDRDWTSPFVNKGNPKGKLGSSMYSTNYFTPNYEDDRNGKLSFTINL